MFNEEIVPEETINDDPNRVENTSLFTFNEETTAEETVKEEPKRVENTSLFTFNEETDALETVIDDPVNEEKLPLFTFIAIPDRDENRIVDAFNEDVMVTTSISVELIITFALSDDTLIVEAVKPEAVMFTDSILVAYMVLPDTVE